MLSSKQYLRLSYRKSALIYDYQKREFWPLVVAGAVIIVGSTVLNYTVRALERMNSDGNSPNDSDNMTSNNKSESGSRIKISQALGIDIGPSNSRIACKLGDELPKIIENEQGFR